MIKTLIFGATGYTGIELIRLLSSHPQAKVVGGSSQQWAGQPASGVLPFLTGDNDFMLVKSEELLTGSDADVAFLALPHGASAALIRPLLDAGLKVIDLSADCRLHDVELYREWYGDHPDPDLLDRAVYGLCETHRDSIKSTDLVANPGCYPTTVILAVAPIIGKDYVDAGTLVADSKSGVSGAGRGAKLATSFCETGEGFKPYGVIRHRHVPEMEQELSAMVGRTINVRFTPHLIPVSRGMVSTVYLRLNGDVTIEEIRAEYETLYRDEPFVKLLPSGAFPDTINVRGSNMCHVSVEKDDRTGWVIAMTAIDNLVKGASGAAVQNMNILMGLPETEGLQALPLYP